MNNNDFKSMAELLYEWEKFYLESAKKRAATKRFVDTVLNTAIETKIECKPITGDSCQLITLSDNCNKAELKFEQGEYNINNVIVDKETYMKAIEVYAAGGDVTAVINSINDILDEYIDNAELERKKEQNAARIKELQDAIKKAQEELNKLK